MITKQVKKVSLFRLYKQFCIVIFLSIYTLANAQVNIEAVAKLHSEIESEPDKWFEGFQSYVSGSYSPYQSHRSRADRDSAFVARTSGGEAMIEWNTSAIPKKWNGDSASFIWVCGFGNNLGNEFFDLNIDDSNLISFSTKNESSWTMLGKNGINLSFTTVYQNSNNANFGYMVLTIPRSNLVIGKALKISIQGRPAENEIWYRLFAYKDALNYAIEKEHKRFFSSVEFKHMGDAIFTLCAPLKNINSEIQLYNSDTLITEGLFTSNGLISKSKFLIPRYLQPVLDSITIVQVDKRSVDTIFWNDINEERLRAFMDETIDCDKYVFQTGDFPEFHWKNEIRVENELGEFPLNVTYYNSDFQKVTSAYKPGRYGAVIEGVTSTGFVIKRYVTLFCSEVELDDYSNNIPIKINQLNDYNIDYNKWQQYENNEQRFSFGSLKYFPQHNPDAAIFLSGLNDLEIKNGIYDTPRNRDKQWWIILKGKLEEREYLHKPLSPPIIIDNDSSPLLSDSTQLSSMYDIEIIKKIKSLCNEWAEKDGVPNITVIVHEGKLIFYDAFGSDENGIPINKDSKMWMASITKLLTGALMMQFVDQGIIDLDSPVGRYLPELNEIANNKLLTVRHLFNHTSGLQFAGEWASDWNLALENQVAQVLPSVDIGVSFAYHRVGYALAGRIIESITGQSIPYLFQEYIFSPLEMNSAFSDNTYGGLYCSPIDLAKFGQMLLNKGTYNTYKLFSEQTFEKMLPKKLNVGDQSWGIGTSPMAGNGLSEAAFGHGAASGTIFRIDPENDLIIISARNKPGKSHYEFENALIKLCTSLVNNH